MTEHDQPLLPSEKGATWAQQRELVAAQLQEMAQEIATLKEQCALSLSSSPELLFVRGFLECLADSPKFREEFRLFVTTKIEANVPPEQRVLTKMLDIIEAEVGV